MTLATMVATMGKATRPPKTVSRFDEQHKAEIIK